MRAWTFWDRIAYLCIWVAAVISAADTAFKLAPSLTEIAPKWLESSIFGFAPLLLLMTATGAFVVGNTGFFAFIGSRHPITLFLERDSTSNLLGIQTFPKVSYIQPSVVASRKMEKCSAWITRVEYDVRGGNFALEFNERFPLPWSKATTGNDFVVDLEPGHPPIRLNAAIFTDEELSLDRGTPINLYPLLQRVGIHRLTIFVSGSRADGKRINETFILDIEWRGREGGAFVKSLKRL